MTVVTSLLAVAAAAVAVSAAPLVSDENPPRKWLSSLPKNISFSCEGRVPGYYADVDSGCQMYHMCDPQSRLYSYLCPALTEFNQFYMTCVHHERVNCSMSEKFYHMNDMIGKPRMLFHAPHRDDHSKKKDTEGSKADNRVEISPPEGHVLFEFEAKLDTPMKDLHSKLRRRGGGAGAASESSHRSRGAGATSRRHQAPAAVSRGAHGPRRGSVQGGGRHRTASSHSAATQPRGAAAATRQTATTATSARQTPAASTASGKATVLATTPRAVPATDDKSKASKSLTRTTPQPSVAPKSPSGPPTTATPRRTTSTQAPSTSTRPKLFDLVKKPTSAESKTTASTSPEPTTSPSSGGRQRAPAVPRNTYKTFGSPGSFAFGTDVDLSRIGTPLPVRTRPTAPTTGATAAPSTTPRSRASVGRQSKTAAGKTTGGKTGGGLSTTTTAAPSRASLPTAARRTTAGQTTTERTTTARTTTERSTSAQSTTQQTTPSRTTTEKTTTEKITTRKSTSAKTTTQRTTTEKTTLPKTSTEKTTTEKTITERKTTAGLKTTQATTEPSTTEKSTTARRVTAFRTLPTETITKATTAESITETTTATTTTTTEKPTEKQTTAQRTTMPKPTTKRPTVRPLVSRRTTATKPTTGTTTTRVSSTTGGSSVAPSPTAASAVTKPASLEVARASKRLPAASELEALKLSFTIEPPKRTVHADGPHEELKMKVKGELITGAMALRKLMVEQLQPVYFPSAELPLNLLPPLLSNQEEPDGGHTTTLTLPVRDGRPNSLSQAAAEAVSLLPPEFASLLPARLVLPPPPPPPTEGTTATPTAQTAASSESPKRSSEQPAKPKKDPDGLTMKFGKKKHGFRVGASHGHEDEACFPCMKSFIKDLDNCHPCVIIR